jgi:hypothetical protein
VFVREDYESLAVVQNWAEHGSKKYLHFRRYCSLNLFQKKSYIASIFSRIIISQLLSRAIMYNCK